MPLEAAVMTKVTGSLPPPRETQPEFQALLGPSDASLDVVGIWNKKLRDGNSVPVFFCLPVKQNKAGSAKLHLQPHDMESSRTWLLIYILGKTPGCKWQISQAYLRNNILQEPPS